MANRRKRGSRRTIGINDADRTQSNLMVCNPNSLDSIDENDGAMTSSKMETLKNIRAHQRCRQNRYVFPTCALLATIITLSGAVRHAAFVTRIGSGTLLKPLAKYRDNPSSHPIGAKNNQLSLSSNVFASKVRHQPTTTMARSMGRFPSLWMSSSDTTEVQSQSLSSAEDEDEWRTVLAAFQMYKAAYGDLKVPSRFVVPGMAPWPEPAWQLKLGQRVAAIRSTGKYVQKNETRRKVLDDMGFLWRLRSPSPGKKLDGIEFSQVYDALKMYRTEVQPTGSALEVPTNFVVPDCEPWPDSTRGLPLGKIMPTVRSKVYLKKHPEAEAKLNSLGFAPDVKTAANDLRYRRVYDALVKYKELYGDLIVPQPFTVPEEGEEWPEEVRGLRLGARVNAIRSQGTFVKSNPLRKEELDKLGFVWEPPANADGKRRGRKRKVESGVDGESSEEEEDSGTAGGEENGVASAATAASSTSESAFDMTRDPFFTGDQSSPPQWAFEGEDDDDDLLMEQEVGDNKYAAPKSFNETLEEMADVAISVGIMERWTSNKRVVKGARDKDVPWRNDDFGTDFVFDDVVEALILYKDLYENFDSIEEEEFIVPEPVEESLRLSPFELAAMNDDSPEELDEIDGPWSEDEDGESMESKFSVVASNDWPEHLAGMKLGQIVSRIREGGLEVKHLPERKKQLDDIGFDWGDPKRFIDVPFEKVMCALYAYYMIRGDTFVKSDFVMPDEQPWPTIFAGYELGAAVTRLRELQNFLEAYHPVKMSLLRMVDFSFFPELALPLDPNADEMNMEHLYVETFGHPLYHISTVPLGLPERMLADGPNGPPEKLSSWYNYEYVREFHEKPGALTDVADWMRDIGFYQLAEEHEQKYGQSHYRQLFLLKDKLDNKEISQEIWDQEIDRIKDEVMEEFENWRQRDTKTAQIVGGVGDGEFDYTINEDEYYYQTLELASSNSQDSSQFERPTMIPNDVIEESVAEFSLGTGDSSNE
mmetsp:Transcript_4127/g.7899  ORF Transcript_4127/g.7899 Transcript_4127/m.7899 type:complete len:987 (-) Transcript_4127:77-3037(-)|eukprot:CAMPEP_0196147592 /NCGR_PEP_ID=MMETSP0910-20130528/25770_1 /TAXON_ID=49265 /ORGANISM="Thalassiosira rotula, Strain GSO102" /LENGTH=986 /DNA_ID=CAMNT_0041410049 /DNA_START=27 /DNA_END=2987 /DNA_ORIENTATION=+